MGYDAVAWLRFAPLLLAHRDPEPFDWYQRYSGIKDLIGQYVKKTDHVLMSGCGNSRECLGSVMVETGSLPLQPLF